MRLSWRVAAVAGALSIACGSEDSSGDSDGTSGGGDDAIGAGGAAGAAGAASAVDLDCSLGSEVVDGECFDPLNALQPASRIDVDNVTGDPSEVTQLDLPEPPKSGFRIIVPARDLGPSAEESDCVAWEYPQIENKYVYATRVYTNGGLHHSNVYGMPLDGAEPSPYPECFDTSRNDVISQVDNLLIGNILDVLFANSTQVEGSEHRLFGDGMAFRLTTEDREIATSIHWLNVNAEPLRSEIVYDIFTMPESEVTTEIVPYYFDNFAFQVPPQTRTDVTTTCDIFGGNYVTMMPHTHERRKSFTVDVMNDAETKRIFELGEFVGESEITHFDQPINVDDFTRLEYSCEIDNELALPLRYGTGDDEMCTLFGYMYPPQAQMLGVILDGQGDCISLNVGANR